MAFAVAQPVYGALSEFLTGVRGDPFFADVEDAKAAYHGNHPVNDITRYLKA